MLRQECRSYQPSVGHHRSVSVLLQGEPFVSDDELARPPIKSRSPTFLSLPCSWWWGPNYVMLPLHPTCCHKWTPSAVAPIPSGGLRTMINKFKMTYFGCKKLIFEKQMLLKVLDPYKSGFISEKFKPDNSCLLHWSRPNLRLSLFLWREAPSTRPSCQSGPTRISRPLEPRRGKRGWSAWQNWQV